MRWSLGWYSEASSGSRCFTLEDLNSALCDLDRASSHGLLQAFRLCEVHVRESLALINLDLVKRAENFERLLDQRLGDTLRWIGMLEESLLARGIRNRLRRRRPGCRSCGRS